MNASLESTPLRVALVTASPEDRQIVERLLQLYEYEYSGTRAIDLDPAGLFPTVDTEAIWRSDYHVYFIKVDGNLAGFAFVTRHQSYLGDDETQLIDEFFVLPKYRRLRVGEHVVLTLFDRFPGRWEVSAIPQNTAAQAFWRRVIGRYTDGTYHKVVVNSDHWHGPVWTFESEAD